MSSVTKNDSGTPSIGGASVALIDLTTFTASAGSDLFLLGLITWDSDKTGTASLVWDNGGTNQSMTLEQKVVNGANGRTSAIYRLVNPTTGNKTLRATWTGNADVILGAIAFSVAASITSADTLTQTTLTASPSVGPITSATDDATVALLMSGQTINTNNQTLIFNTVGGGINGGATYALGGSSNTHSWTLASVTNDAVIGVHVKAAAAAGGDPNLVGDGGLGGMCLAGAGGLA